MLNDSWRRRRAFIYDPGRRGDDCSIYLAHHFADAKISAHNFSRRGGRAVDCAGLENRKAERPREFESHPLRHFDLEPLTRLTPKSIAVRHNKAIEIRPCPFVSRRSGRFRLARSDVPSRFSSSATRFRSWRAAGVTPKPNPAEANKSPSGAPQAVHQARHIS